MPKSHYNTVKNKKGKFVKLSNEQLLKNSHPKLLNEWDYNKNKKISLKGLSYKSVKSVYWKCKKTILGLQVLTIEP